MKKITFITPADSEYGFRLTGIRQLITDEKEAENTLHSIVREPDTELVIIDERLLKAVPEKKIKEIENSWKGILLVLPAPVRPEVLIEDYAARLIRRAIGYHVRLNI